MKRACGENMGKPAIYASDPAASRGRLYGASSSPTRSEFQRDRDRIIHSTAFRRLQYKTQVFLHHEGQHFRTRLTHTLEVSQMARSIARALGLDEDLAEAVALAHDLGHTPFGHAGERILNEKMAPWGGFDHNLQALRVVTRLENRYAEHDGLNLTWETLEGILKHNGPVTEQQGLAEIPAPGDLEPGTHASLEAQVARGHHLRVGRQQPVATVNLDGMAGIVEQCGLGTDRLRAELADGTLDFRAAAISHDIDREADILQRFTDAARVVDGVGQRRHVAVVPHADHQGNTFRGRPRGVRQAGEHDDQGSDQSPHGAMTHLPRSTQLRDNRWLCQVSEGTPRAATRTFETEVAPAGRSR